MELSVADHARIAVWLQEVEALSTDQLRNYLLEFYRQRRQAESIMKEVLGDSPCEQTRLEFDFSGYKLAISHLGREDLFKELRNQWKLKIQNEKKVGQVLFEQWGL